MLLLFFPPPHVLHTNLSFLCVCVKMPPVLSGEGNFKNRLCCRLNPAPSVYLCITSPQATKSIDQLFYWLLAQQILKENAHRHPEWTLMLDGISCPRTVKTSMKHGFEHCVEVRVWSIGIYCSCRLNVMTLTELIHAVKHTDSRPSPASSTSRLWRTVSYLLDFTICHLSPLPGPRRTPQTSRTRLQARVSLTAT